MSFSCVFADSPASQRRLHRTIDAGMGFFSRHAPFEYSKKSVHGSTEVFMSDGWMPLGDAGVPADVEFVWAKVVVAARAIATNSFRMRMAGFSVRGKF